MSLIFHSGQIGIYLLMCGFTGQIGIDLFVLGVRTWALTLFLGRETAITQKRPYHASRQM